MLLKWILFVEITCIDWQHVRTSTVVVLNSYIAIFSTTKYQNVSYNGGAKTIFFGSTATGHSYFWLCIVAEKLKKKKISLFVRSHYFWLFYSFLFFLLFLFHIPIYCLCVHMLLFFYSYIFFFSYILFFYLCVHTAIIVDILFYCDVYIILLC